MTQYQTDDLRIKNITEVQSPSELHEKYPLTEASAQTVYDTRQQIHNILVGRDDRLLVVIGPCSIHDPAAARDYAAQLKTQIEKFKDTLLIVMRVYFEKPRTTVGWKGLINDPNLNESFEINIGLGLARSLLSDINNMGVPAATEFLDLISPQYVADLIAWGAIGARTTESQGHRELASGLSCPVGFKNGTDGGFKVAVDAIRAANNPHIFMSLTKNGHSAIFETSGNEDCHVILRGGNDGPNYEESFVKDAVSQLQKAGVNDKLMIDCSHANSSKQHERQMVVADSVADQLAKGTPHIMGVMVESHLIGGRQDVEPGRPLTYGQSITDACIDWDDSLTVLETLAKGVKARRAMNKA
ncbi:3-deoxy-7-phosphoheptulonate synthase AroG [Thiomicrorhabdus arctica]|jgi:3-deoxy-7-phosphoheptulonate synthase|uniref:3-deoxy-7-phosphoheptulonate synthase AroG n=1 Tax=Thiomicrorhabdus arctica TaxID=131540 RepID=UPI0003772FFE|nr:3-deoxy-7-phosphoheptulonate synthase AroG [Thiomicrorhabdus arctica]